nr:hypothetical protein [Lachnospiraceae bacterium]
MKEISKRILILHILFGFAIALWLVAVLGRAAYTAGNQIKYTEGRFYECADGWYDDEGNEFNIEKYVFSENDLNKETVLHYKIPEKAEFDGDVALCFYSRGMNFDVYSNGEEGPEEIFSYDQEAAKLSGTDIGLTVHVVPLCEDDTDNEITIAITPTEISS